MNYFRTTVTIYSTGTSPPPPPPLGIIVSSRPFDTETLGYSLIIFVVAYSVDYGGFHSSSFLIV